MNTSLKGLLAVIAIGLPGVAFAQSSDAQYCAALVGKYEQYLDMSSKREESSRRASRPRRASRNARPAIPQAFPPSRRRLRTPSTACRRDAYLNARYLLHQGLGIVPWKPGRPTR